MPAPMMNGPGWRLLAALARRWTAWRGDAVLTYTCAMPRDWTDTGYEPGRRARAAILAELRRGEDAGEDAPTLRKLAAVVGVHWTGVERHVGILVDAGLVRHGDDGIELTRRGRLATRV